MKLFSPVTVKNIALKYGFHFRKNLGQNFLIDGNIVNKIVEAAEIGPDDVVLEIGAGIGTLTRALAEKAGRVVVIEIDRNLEPVLQETLADCHNVEIIWGNAQKVDFDRIVAEKTQSVYGKGGKPYKIAANLPYYITTPLIMYSLESKFNVELMVIMVQKEVAQRLTAAPASKDYGSLTVSVGYYTEPRMVFNVPKQVFFPQPEVESTVVSLRRRSEPPVRLKDENLFFEIIRAAFQQRRKTLANALTGLPGEPPKTLIAQILEGLGIDSGRRGETLSLQEFAQIADALAEKNKIWT